jgi:hypothetical protein
VLISCGPPSGDITLGEAAEVGRLIDSCVKGYRAAELDDRVARVEQMSDTELMRVITSAQAAEAATTQKLLTLKQR